MNVLGILVQREATQVSVESVSDLLCSALEGGSNYWASISGYIKPKNVENMKFMSDPERKDVFKHLDYPLNQGGAVIISDSEDNETEHRLDLPVILKGLELMANKFPKHWTDFISENGDGDTGDVFLQCALFGDVIYG